MYNLDIKINNNIKGYFMLIACMFISAITLDFNNAEFRFLFLLPLTYGFLCVLVPVFLHGFSLRTPGFLILNIVMVLRYLFLPVALKYSDYYRALPIPYSNSLDIAVTFMLLELITIGICVYFFTGSYKNRNKFTQLIELENPNEKQKNLIVFLVLIIFVIIILSDLSVLKKFSFINIQEGFSHQVASNQITAGTLSSLAIVWFRLLLPILWIKICKDMYIKTRLNSWAYISTIVPILSLLFFSGLSRSSILIPALALALILGRTFPLMRKKLYSIILSAAVFSVSTLTIYKTFNSTSVSQGLNMIDVSWISNTLEAYFGGVYNVAIAIDAKDFFQLSININTLFSDLFRSWMGIGALFRDSYSTSEYFNIMFYGGVVTFDQVVPTIGSSYMLFGIFGSMLFTILIVWLICMFEKLYQKEGSIELAYLYGFTAIQCAFNLPGNFLIIASYLLNTFLPLFLIFKLNQLIILKRMR